MGLEDRLNERDGKKADDGGEAGEGEDEGELDLEGIDDDEIDSYIVSEKEASSKEDIWMKINAEYLKEQQEKEERLAKEREEGKPEKKKRKINRKPKNNHLANTAGEAIEKMLQEKKISSKINYEVLRSLTDKPLSVKTNPEVKDVQETPSPVVRDQPPSSESITGTTPVKGSFRNYRIPKKPVPKVEKITKPTTPPRPAAPPEDEPLTLKMDNSPEPNPDEQDYVEELEEEEEDENTEMSVARLVSLHRGEEDYYDEYDEDDYA